MAVVGAFEDSIGYSVLSGLSWHVIRVQLRNVRNKEAASHPLDVLRAIVKSAIDKDKAVAEEISYTLRPLSWEGPKDDSPHQLQEGDRIYKGALYRLDIVLPGAQAARIEPLLARLKQSTENFRVEGAQVLKDRTLPSVLQEGNWLDFDGSELCLEFTTPLALSDKAGPSDCWRYSLPDLVRAMQVRVQELFGVTVDVPENALRDMWLVPALWHFEHWGGRGQRRQELLMRGAVGPLYLRGNLRPLLPLLLLCSEVNVGARLHMGQGCCLLLRNRPFFDAALQDPQVWREAYEAFETREDQPVALFTEAETQASALDILRAEVLEQRYEPAAAHGFYAAKRSGGERLITVLPDRDKFVHYLLQGLLCEPMDRTFEEASIGYRRGKSRETARRVVSEAIRLGYRYVLETDIDSFFDEIDWDLLEEKLARILPLGDTLTKRLIGQCVRTDILVKGKPVPREKGVLQGSPLSPLLSNLFLDSFDEEMEAQGFKLLRFADDVIVLTKTADEAVRARTVMQEVLGRARLKLNEDKTDIRPIEAGFLFLGMNLGNGMGEAFVEKASLQKTLYSPEQYVFLGIDGEALVIRKQQRLLSRFPMARLGGLVLLGSQVISTKLMIECSKRRIPISFCSWSGFHISTLTPAVHDHHDVAGLHWQQFVALKDDDRLHLARQIVLSKIWNYVPWISQYVRMGERRARRLARLISGLERQTTREALRGYEGRRARLVYRFMVGRIMKPGFESRTRVPHEKYDRLNALLDAAYSLLGSRLNVTLRQLGLNPYLGFLHSDKDRYESLAEDLKELFRHRVDRLVVNLINLGTVQPSHFEEKSKGAGYRLTHEGYALLFESFEKELKSRYANEPVSFAQLLSAQCNTLLHWVQNGGLPGFYVAERNLSPDLLVQTEADRVVAGE